MPVSSSAGQVAIGRRPVGASSAGRPVRVRKTSSRVGLRRDRSPKLMPARVEQPHRVGQHGGALLDPHRDLAAAPCRSGPRWRCRRPPGRSARPPAGRWSRSVTVTSMTSPPTLAFSSSDVPSAMTSAVVDDHDPVGQLVGLLQVLGGEQHRGALGHQLPDDLPQVDPRPRVQAGGRLVQEQDRGPADQAGAQVQPAAHAPRVGLHGAVGGVGQAEALEQIGRPGAWPPALGRW